ncbi:hypothetical protein, partial [Pseudomonas viridiflava]|uniref:hypothetical protein n=1 Tax=Pseudomonas viridiflava TaxID=33069 RepID=UPI001981C046
VEEAKSQRKGKAQDSDFKAWFHVQILIFGSNLINNLFFSFNSNSAKHSSASAVAGAYWHAAHRSST